jgi:hypothetical protein
MAGQARSAWRAWQKTHPLSHCAIHPAGSLGNVGSVGPESGDTGGMGGVGAAILADGRLMQRPRGGKQPVRDVEGGKKTQKKKEVPGSRARISQRALIWESRSQSMERWVVLVSGR